MSKFLCLLVLVLVLCSFAFGQEKPNFDAGSKALLFEWSGFSDLGANAYMGGIGGKYFISPLMGVRGALQFSHMKMTNPFNPVPGTNQTGKDGESTASLFGLAGAVEVHLSAQRVSPFFGGGISFQTTSTEEKDMVTDPNPQTTTKNANGYNEFAIFGLVGVEFFLYKQMISLAAEYDIGYAKRSYKDEEITSASTTVTYKQGSGSFYGIENSGMITLAVYLP